MVTCEKINYMHALLFNNSFKTIYIFSLFGFFGKCTTCYHSGIGEAPIEKLSFGFWNTYVYLAASSFIMVDISNWCKVACQFQLIKGQTDQRRNFLKLRDVTFLTFYP